MQEITERLRAEGVAVSMISGQIDDSERDFVIDEFKAGRTKAMVTSDLLARGTDVLAVQLVFNYDVPFTRVQQQGELVVKAVRGAAERETSTEWLGRQGAAWWPSVYACTPCVLPRSLTPLRAS